MNLTEAEKGYIAGILDGEGSLSCTFDGGYLFFAVGMADTAVVEWLQTKLGGKVYTTSNKYMHTGKSYHWQLNGAECQPVLEAVRPYVVLKRMQVELALKLIATLKPRSERGIGLTENEALLKIAITSALRSLSVGRHKGKEKVR